MCVILTVPVHAQGVEYPVDEQQQTGQKVQDSVFSYMSDKEIIVYILYGNLDDLLLLAKALGIDPGENPDLETLRKKLLEYYGYKPKQIGSGTDTTLLIKESDIVQYYEVEDQQMIELRGNINVIWQGKLLSADLIIINQTRKTIYGKGNIRFQDGTTVLEGEEFQFDIGLGKGVFYFARGFIDQYYITSDELKMPTIDTVVTQAATATTCSLAKPHFFVTADQIFYSPDLIVFSNLRVYVGNTLVFYFPLYFSLERGPGFPWNFGMNYARREGLFFFDTLHFAPGTVMADFYERLGFFIGLNFASNAADTKKTGITWDMKGGVALSPDLFYVGSVYPDWTFIPPGGTWSWDNFNFRYGIAGSARGKLFSFLNWNFSGEYVSDPYFMADFVDRGRELNFKLGNFLKTRWDVIYPSADSGFSETLGFNVSLSGFNFSNQSSMSFITTTTGLPIAWLYSPKYYKYYLNSLNLYNMTASLSSLNVSLDWLTASLGINGSANETNTYSTTEELIKKTRNYSVNVSPSLALNFSWLSFTSSWTPSVTYSELYQYGTADPYTNGDSRFTFNLSNTMRLNFDFLSFAVSMNQSYLQYLFEKTDLYPWNSNVINANLTITPFTWLSVSSSLSYTCLDKAAEELFVWDMKNFGTMVNQVNLRFQALSFTWADSWSVTLSKAIQDSFTLNIVTGQLKFDDFSFSLSDTMVLFINYKNQYNQYFSNSFSLNASLKDEFAVSLSVVSRNNYLYVYSNGGVFDWGAMALDLLKSFNFFNEQDRLDSLFDLSSISLTLSRNLHDFTLSFSITGSYVLDTASATTGYVFLTTFSISIISITLSDLKFSEDWEIQS